jgi:hypothetical protein
MLDQLCNQHLQLWAHCVARHSRGNSIIDPALLRGHGEGNGSGVSADNAFYTSIAVVTTDGLHPNFPRLHSTTTESFIPASCFVGTPNHARKD